MVRLNRAVLLGVFALAVVIGVVNILNNVYVVNIANATTAVIDMAATIQPSMTVMVSDSSKSINITPSSAGTFGYTSLTVGTYSNGSVGYTLVMTPSTTSLNSANNSSIPTLSANSNCSGGSTCTSSNFAVGHWGIAVGTETYRPAATRNIATVANTNNTTQSNSYTIYLGANLNTDTLDGTYTTTLNFAATASVRTQTVTFNFDSGITSLAIKDASGATVATISASGNSAALKYGNTYTIVPTYASGYIYDTISSNKGELFMDVDIPTYTVGGTDTVAVTSKAKIYMQDVTNSQLASLMPNVGNEVTLYDNRDEKSYTVAKLSDGNYWMTQNLDHDIVTTTNFYTSLNTDLDDKLWTASATTRSASDTTWNGSGTVIESYDPGDVCWDGIIYDWDGEFSTAAVACGVDKHYHVGNYYNWTAAIAMNDSSSIGDGDAGTDVGRSICPAGWQLPLGGEYSNSRSFSYLVNHSDMIGGIGGNVQDLPWYFVYSGYIIAKGSSEIIYFGSIGGLWSSVVGPTSGAYLFEFNSDDEDIYPGGYDGGQFRGEGYPIRCVKRLD